MANIIQSDLTNLGTQWKKPLKDQATPYKMALMVLIEEYCKFSQKPRAEMRSDERFTEREEREFMILLLELVQTSDLELKDFIHKLEDFIKPFMMDLLLSRVKELSEEGISAVMDLFQSIQESLFKEENAPLHKSSVIGLFIRRMCLAFDKLSFAQVTKLHQRYQLFYESWVTCHKENTDKFDMSELGEASMSIMEIMGTSHGETSKKDPNPSFLDAGRYSQRQAEYFIAQQATLIQHNELEALSPKQLQDRISELLTSNPELTEAHYLSYLNNLRIREYCGAMERLVQYFDQHQVPSSPNGSSSLKRPNEEINRSCSFAALNMAALHFQFGHRQEALAAVTEAIRIAQEANDHVCLQHALGWLQRFGFESPSSVGYILDRLVTKAGELNLPYLTSLGLQALAKHIALATTQPSSIFEFLLKSDILNCQNSQSDLMCVSYAQKAALWQLYGRREMCNLNSQLMLHLNTALMGIYHNGDSECIALCHLARLHADQGEYDLASEILGTARRRFPVNTQHAPLWMVYEQQLSFTRASLKGDWPACDTAIDNMAAVDDLESCYCRCVLLKEKGEPSSSIEHLDKLIERYREMQKEQQELPELYARLLILQAELQCGTGNATTAGQPLLACLSICRERHFSYMVAMTTVHLAYVQFSLGMPQQALTLIEEVLTIILSHGSLFDKARAQYLWTKCHVSVSSRKGANEKQKAMRSAVKMMDDVIGWFQKIESFPRVKDAIYYQARLYHELGHIADRNKCALEFKKLDQQYPTWNSSSVSSL